MRLLQNRIDRAYRDKLDNKIGEDFWQRKTSEWILEKENLAIKLVSLQKENTHYLENVRLILELSENASRLFKRANAEQKRKLISLLVSNCSYAAEKLDVELKTSVPADHRNSQN